MGWFKQQLLKRALKKAWYPHVKFDFSKWGFEIILIDPTPIRILLDDGTDNWKEISRLAFEITNEIIKMTHYEINESSMELLKGGVTMNDADSMSELETLALNNRILEYENQYHTSIMERYIDYILTCGYKYL